eukprot:TRINITY_DN54384_c0_g1_i1.p1 TRINITY_DN54384_c0_g1~~TRINITY_DN54384_c0_g1_i1.p1  ORF type:complete len:295 (+),score=31.61 TRINITY_DN54384_c0_g1_i1:88-972(+)
MCPPSCYCAAAGGTLGALGALAFIVTYRSIPSLRTRTRSVMLALSVSDLLLAITLGTVQLPHDLEYISTNETWCLYMGIPLQFALISSALWSAVISVMVYFKVTEPLWQPEVRHLVLCHVLCWGFPLATVLVGLGTQYAQRGVVSFTMDGRCLAPINPWHSVGRVYHWISYRGPLVACLLLSCVLCSAARVQVNIAEAEVGSLLADVSQRMREIGRRLLWIPALFVLTRCWGTVTSLLSIAGVHYFDEENYGVLCFVTFLDALQGFCNCIVFVVLNPHVQQWVAGHLQSGSGDK